MLGNLQLATITKMINDFVSAHSAQYMLILNVLLIILIGSALLATFLVPKKWLKTKYTVYILDVAIILFLVYFFITPEKNIEFLTHTPLRQ